ncbi:hypothetical protein N665_0374s0011, partial [Sinapis alba]
LSQGTTLVNLVDYRDIVELQLKQLDCELVIRKKEALPQPQSSAPYVMMQTPNQPSYVQATAPPSAPAASPAPSFTPASLPPPFPPAPAKSSLPSVKSPLGRDEKLNIDRLSQEVLIIWGDKDQIFPVKMAYELKDQKETSGRASSADSDSEAIKIVLEL